MGENIIAGYEVGDGELAVIEKVGNGYFNRYGWKKSGIYNCSAGAFETFEQAERILVKHRPLARKIYEQRGIINLELSRREVDLIYAALMYYGNKLSETIKDFPNENMKELQKRAKESYQLASLIVDLKK